MGRTSRVDPGLQERGHMARVGAQAHNGDLGAVLPVGPMGRAPGQGGFFEAESNAERKFGSSDGFRDITGWSRKNCTQFAMLLLLNRLS